MTRLAAVLISVSCLAVLAWLLLAPRELAAPEAVNKPGELVGVRFESAAEVDHAMARLGYSRIGTFGEHWPAVLQRTSTGIGGRIDFTHGTQPHSYEMRNNTVLTVLQFGPRDRENSLVYQRPSGIAL